MCLGIPARIITIEPDGLQATVESWGIRAQVSLALVEDCRPGTYVLVHAGHAISIIDEKEAEARLTLWQNMASGERTGVD
ncbi:HypC/HybG/HupF family hydrogenase formation chaperone [Moorellaceae bacterium AZ2]